MSAKTKNKRSIGDQIRDHFQRNQSWLARQIGMSESQLSNKMKDKKDWTQEELDKINKVLGTDFKL